MKTLIQNPELIATLDGEDRQIRGGALLIEQGRIAEVFDSPQEIPADRIIDARGKLITPGLVNTHHHFYQTLTRNLPAAQDAELFDWLNYHYEIWRGLDEEMISVSTRTALAELMLSGCTLSSDHHYVFPESAAPDLIDRQIEVARDLGLRFHATRGSMSLGRSAGGLPPDDLVQDEGTILEDSRRLLSRYHDPSEDAMIRVELAPCSPFSVSEEAMRQTSALARESGCRLHTHLAETGDEEEFCLNTHGLRPYELMEKLGWTGSDTWFAHAIHLDPAEIQRMADSGTGMSHCPSSNMRLGSGIAPIREMLDAGVPVSLAVDGSASNDGNHLLAEARQALLLSRLRPRDFWLSAGEVWRIACEGGARVLGRSGMGRIEAGALADLALWDLETLGLAGAGSDPLAAMLFSASAPRVHTLLVAGEVLVESGKLSDFDEPSQIAAQRRAAERLGQ